ncbi:hypothetical protein CPB83DRAFT_853434 [Crepidotus variabilis]|uniref:Secreted protein n=1 Tax=Crepidotus variabilis TaxID=179855 RepID=A0A9P6EG42_9AGAR|nr:hypothetical protein CPB83DRAFT_853434 [Crepidotus variabilis]
MFGFFSAIFLLWFASSRNPTAVNPAQNDWQLRLINGHTNIHDLCLGIRLEIWAGGRDLGILSSPVGPYHRFRRTIPLLLL